MGNIILFIGALLAFPAGIIAWEDKFKQNPKFEIMLYSAKTSFNELIKWLSRQDSMSILIEIGKYLGVASLTALLILGVAQQINPPVNPMLATIFFVLVSFTGALGWFFLLRNAWQIILVLTLLVSALPIFLGEYNFFIEKQANTFCGTLQSSNLNCAFFEKFPLTLRLPAIIFIIVFTATLLASIVSFILVFIIAAVISLVLGMASYFEKIFPDSTFDGVLPLVGILAALLIIIGSFLNI